MKNACCDICKFYKDGWCGLLMIEMPKEHRCNDFESNIVRCKDCKYGYVCENNVRCENEKNPAMIGMHNGFEWFCADGERKDEHE